MLLKALYDYARKHSLLKDPHLDRRTLHALVPLDAEGRLRFDHLISLTHEDAKGKQRPGQERLMPRFPGDNTGGKADFLHADAVGIFGRDKATGDPVPSDPAKCKNKNPAKAFLHFWQQIEVAHRATKDSRLSSLLGFRERYLTEQDGQIVADLPFLRMRPNQKGKLEFVAGTGIGNESFLVLKNAKIGFSIEGKPLTLEDESDPLRSYWFSHYMSERNPNESLHSDNELQPSNHGEPTICLITGRVGQPIARSHNPKILGVPNVSGGGRIVSFARQAPAFSSYGFEMGQNAPVSEEAAPAYVLAMNELLRSEDNCLKLGPTAICFWAKASDDFARRACAVLDKAHPEQVREFLRAPFAGVADREIRKRDRLYTIALGGNAGRVVVQHWLDQSLDDASEHLKNWWNDLAIISIYSSNSGSGDSGSGYRSPLAIPNLARAIIRLSKSHKDDKLVGERIVQLYRAALEGTAPPLVLLKPLLDEFHSALVKNDDSDPKRRTYPLSQSRFALIKLILLRNRKSGDVMPQPRLAETPDPAYNLGRLLAVFEGLQDRYHDFEKAGAGIVERYYGTASSAPAAAFPLLCRLARHHLSKVRKDDDGAARGLEARITQVLAKFEPEVSGQPPVFPRMLTLQQQGVFALGFYQQKAHETAHRKVRFLLAEARSNREGPDKLEELTTRARQVAEEYGDPELIDLVEAFERNANGD